MKLRPGYIEITADIREQIRRKIKRTGIAPQRLLKGNSEAKKLGLTSGMIYAYAGINKPVKSGKKAQVEFAIKLWDDVPDGIKKEHANNYRSTKNDYLPISSEDRIKLKTIQKLTGILPRRIFELGLNTPKYLNSNIVGLWLTKEDYTADPDDVKWVLNACEEVLQEALDLYK